MPELLDPIGRHLASSEVGTAAIAQRHPLHGVISRRQIESGVRCAPLIA